MKPLRRALQNGPSPMAIRHSWQKLFKVFTAPTQRERSIAQSCVAPLPEYMYTCRDGLYMHDCACILDSIFKACFHYFSHCAFLYRSSMIFTLIFASRRNAVTRMRTLAPHK